MRPAAIPALLIVALAVVPATAAEPIEAKVTYVSGTTVYLDAGSDRGLATGSIVEVVRGGEVVARLEVGTVTVKRSSATILEGASAGAVLAGDVARFVPVAPPVIAVAPEDAPQEKSRASRRESGVGGRVGLRWLSVRDASGLGQDFSQPALDLRLVGRSVGGVPVDFEVDCRPRRTYRRLVDGSSNDSASNRIYSLMAAFRPGPFRIAVGRQSSPSLGGLVLLDGVTAEYRTPRFATGLIAGSEPDPEDFGYASDTKDYGLYVEGSSSPGAATRWWVNGGAISSTTDGEINRDWVYVTGRLAHKGFSGFALQEVDLNRGWREDFEGASITRSGSFLALRQSFTHGWAANAGWDSRRNVPVYRDRVTPATEFDDATREGIWGGVDWSAPHWSAGVEGRRSSSETSGSADAYSVRLGSLDWTEVHLDARLRGTWYTNPVLEGQLYSASVGFDLWDGRLNWDVHGGMRDEQDTTLFAQSTSVHWVGTELGLLAVRHLFVTLSFDRTTGGDEDNDQLYLSASYRF